jgi:hypothetical protein
MVLCSQIAVNVDVLTTRSPASCDGFSLRVFMCHVSSAMFSVVCIFLGYHAVSLPLREFDKTCDVLICAIVVSGSSIFTCTTSTGVHRYKTFVTKT